MTIGIYAITHIASGKKYVGKSVNVERRLITHKCHNTAAKRSIHATNRYLYNAVQKHGWSAFTTEILEVFIVINEERIAERELYWMDFYRTTERDYGFNLRRDSSTGMITHAETKKLMSGKTGSLNPNFGNTWSDEMKRKMSVIAKNRHASGVFGDEWKKKQSDYMKKRWLENAEFVATIGKKVSESRTRYKIIQLTKDGTLVKEWFGMRSLLIANPTFKRHNIYAVCSGEKPSIYGYLWRKDLINV